MTSLRVGAAVLLLVLAAALLPTAEQRSEARPVPDALRDGLLAAPPLAGARSEEPSSPTPTATPEPTPTPARRAPLTGQALDPAAAPRPIVAVKVDNTATARPQQGLQHADVVIVQLVEAATRFVALYHSADPGRIGPVRSGRFVDADLLVPFAPLLAMSGAAEPVHEALHDADLELYETGSAGAWHIDESRRAPHQVFVHPAALWAAARADADAVDAATPPEAPWRFDERRPGVGAAVERVAWRYPAATGVVWRWDSERRRWVRSQDGHAQRTVDGSRIAADNVVVVRAPRGPNHTRPVEVVGAGPVLLLRDGRGFAGTWRKPARDAHFAWRDDDATLSLRPGTTWIELVPDDVDIRVE